VLSLNSVSPEDIYQQGLKRRADYEAAKQKVALAYEIGRHGNGTYRLCYSVPVRFNTSRYRHKESPVHFVSKIFLSGGGYYCYAPKSNSRRGWEIPIENLVSVNVIHGKADVFNSLEEFAKKFDKRFITDEEIKSLWESKSGQHGGQYRPSDFRRVSKVMKNQVKQFVETVQDIRIWKGTKGPLKGFCELDKRYYCSVEHESWHTSGRDIKIEYMLGGEHVYYKSEFHRCGNGSYGLLATENTWLHLEDD
jgi:hypothetical protein